MFKAFDFCLPTRSTKVPSGPDWLHEIKYDGYRLRLERDHDRVRLITRGGYNWTDRYPWIVEAARKARQKRFVLDGEAVVLGVSMVSPTSAPCIRASTITRCSSAPSTSWSRAAMIFAPCHCRCARPTSNGCWRARRPEGIFVNPFERGEIGPDLFRAACRMGLEGIVSKRRDRPYRGGRSKDWIKVKNRKHPAMQRVMDSFR